MKKYKCIVLDEAKEQQIKQLTKLSPIEKTKIQTIVNKAPQRAKEIDWNKKDHTYDELIKKITPWTEGIESFKKHSESGLTEGEDYKVYRGKESGNLFLAPFNLKASCHFGYDVGPEHLDSRWCVTNPERSMWGSYTREGKVYFFFYSVDPSFRKCAIEVHKDKHIIIWNYKNESHSESELPFDLTHSDLKYIKGKYNEVHKGIEDWREKNKGTGPSQALKDVVFPSDEMKEAVEALIEDEYSIDETDVEGITISPNSNASRMIVEIGPDNEWQFLTASEMDEQAREMFEDYFVGGDSDIETLIPYIDKEHFLGILREVKKGELSYMSREARIAELWDASIITDKERQRLKDDDTIEIDNKLNNKLVDHMEEEFSGSPVEWYIGEYVGRNGYDNREKGMFLRYLQREDLLDIDTYYREYIADSGYDFVSGYDGQVRQHNDIYYYRIG